MKSTVYTFFPSTPKPKKKTPTNTPRGRQEQHHHRTSDEKTNKYQELRSDFKFTAIETYLSVFRIGVKGVRGKDG